MKKYNASKTELQAIQARLRDAINQSGIKQKDIADAIGVSAQTVSKYMTSDVMPALDTLAKLCTLIDVSSDYILGINNFEDFHSM